MDGQDLPRPEFIRDTGISDSSRRKISVFKCMLPGCGKEFESLKSYVLTDKWNRVKSCGCYQKKKVAETGHKNKTHGKSQTYEYYIFKTMKARCYNTNNSEYHNYGGRGITICERWLDKEKGFENFLEDMGNKPDGKYKYSIERHNNAGNYEPENCYWATGTEQGRNRRDNRLITYKGYTKPLVEWSEITGLKREAIANRLNKGWSVEDALTTIPYKKERITINLPEIKDVEN